MPLTTMISRFLAKPDQPTRKFKADKTVATIQRPRRKQKPVSIWRSDYAQFGIAVLGILLAVSLWVLLRGWR